ncbi:MAG: PAS domain-containing sensor histidine kinase [Chloroflexota bacterium]
MKLDKAGTGLPYNTDPSALLNATILDTIAGLVVVLDREGRIVAFNRACQKTTGYSTAEVEGKLLWDIFVLPEEIEGVKAIFARLRAGDFPNEHQNYWRAKDGQLHWIAWSNSALVGADGEVSHVIGTGSDITGRRRAEEELEAARAEAVNEKNRLDAVLQILPVGVAIVDAQGGGARTNLMYDQIWSGPRPQTRSVDDYAAYQAWWVDTGRPVQPEEWASAQAVLKGEAVHGQYFQIQRFDGRRAYVLNSGAPILDAAGQVAGSAVAILDVSERVASEEALRESEEQARNQLAEIETIYNSANVGLCVFDAQLRYLRINERMAEINGVPAAEHIGRTVREVVPDLAPLSEELARRVFETGEGVQDIEFSGTTASQPGELRTWVEQWMPLKDGSGRVIGINVAVEEITERKQAEIERERLLAELMQLDQLKDQFLYVAAHELKTPVAIMKGYAQALLRYAEELTPARRKMLTAIDHGADRIDGIVDDLLDIERLRAGQLDLEKECFDLAALVEEMVDGAAVAACNHNLILTGNRPVAVHGDRERLGQVLAELLDNARRYSPESGDIEVAMEARDGQAVVSVKDNGVGIPREKQERIFQRFYRAHTRTAYDYGGMGVGLYISKEIVERHGGRLWFQSEEQRGSTFFLSLPLNAQGCP